MSTYEVQVTIEDVPDTVTLEARSPIEAAFYAGISLGISLVSGHPEAALAAAVRGLLYVQEAAEETVREVLTSVLVEEL